MYPAPPVNKTFGLPVVGVAGTAFSSPPFKLIIVVKVRFVRVGGEEVDVVGEEVCWSEPDEDAGASNEVVDRGDRGEQLARWIRVARVMTKQKSAERQVLWSDKFNSMRRGKKSRRITMSVVSKFSHNQRFY